jgi:RNA polymerase sigma-70 factor (ECF subfamily)
MIRSLRSYRGDGAFGAWLRRIAVSKALTAIRSKKRRPDIDGEAFSDLHLKGAVPVPIDEGGGWRRVDLERALAMLPDDARAVVWLFDVEGLTHREIAELFGRTTSFSKSRLSRAHARLRELLGRNGGLTDASESGRSVGATGR